MIANPEAESSHGAPFALRDLASWQVYVAQSLQIRKSKATDSDILRVSRQLARLQDTAVLAQSPSEQATADPLNAFAQALEACSGR